MEVVKGPDSIREEKLSQMVMQYEESLIRMCAVYLRDIQLAEDAVQDTFVKAYKHLHSFRGDSSKKTWLMKIAINTCRDIRRQSWHRYVDRRVNLDFLPEPVFDPDPIASDVSLAVMRLPRKYLDVILLYYYQGMNTKEIADAINIPQRTVSSRLMRGRERLREMLEKEAAHETF